MTRDAKSTMAKHQSSYNRLSLKKVKLSELDAETRASIEMGEKEMREGKLIGPFGSAREMSIYLKNYL